MSEVASRLQPASGPAVANASNESFGPSRPVSRLPRIDLPSFDWSFQLWETFRDRFKSMIIDDPVLSNVERMHYLYSVLPGDASNALRHLAVTDGNFEVAWKIISTRYENKYRLINAHLQTLCFLPSMTTENAKDLQMLLDKVNMALNALKNLGRPVNTWDDVIVFLMSQKLDKVSRKAWEMKLSDTVEFPSYSELDKFLEARIRALDAIIPLKESSSSELSVSRPMRNKHLSSHSTVAVKRECIVCQRNHPLYQCVQFLAYTPARRYEFIKSQKRCLNCLRESYL